MKKKTLTNQRLSLERIKTVPETQISFKATIFQEKVSPKLLFIYYKWGKFRTAMPLFLEWGEMQIIHLTLFIEISKTVLLMSKKMFRVQ